MEGVNICDLAIDFQTKNGQMSCKVYDYSNEDMRKILRKCGISGNLEEEPSLAFQELVKFVSSKCECLIFPDAACSFGF